MQDPEQISPEVLEALREHREQVAVDPWKVNRDATERRLLENGRRPLGVNLAEALDLSDMTVAMSAGSAPGSTR